MKVDDIPGVKVIFVNTARIDRPDDPSLPYKLEAKLRLDSVACSWGLKAAVGNFEIIVIRAMTYEALEQAMMACDDLKTNPRLVCIEFTSPSGVTIHKGRAS